MFFLFLEQKKQHTNLCFQLLPQAERCDVELGRAWKAAGVKMADLLIATVRKRDGRENCAKNAAEDLVDFFWEMFTRGAGMVMINLG